MGELQKLQIAPHRSGCFGQRHVYATAMNTSDEQLFVELVSDYHRNRKDSFPKLLAITRRQRADTMEVVLGVVREQDRPVYDRLCQRINDGHLTKEDLRLWRTRIQSSHVRSKHVFEYAIGYVVVATVLVNVFNAFGFPGALNNSVLLALGVLTFWQLVHAWSVRNLHSALESLDCITATVLENFDSIARGAESDDARQRFASDRAG